MLTLAIDTSCKTAQVAITKDGLTVFEVTSSDKRQHSVKLIPMIDYCLNSSGISISDIDLYCVTNGPGSFTGLRIGVTVAKTLAYASSKPVVGVNTLYAIAYSSGYGSYNKGYTCSMVDALNQRVYTCILKDNEEVLPPSVITLDELLTHIKNIGSVNFTFCGDGALVYREQIKASIGSHAFFCPDSLNCSRASVIANLGEIIYSKENDPYTFDPFKLNIDYMKEFVASQRTR